MPPAIPINHYINFRNQQNKTDILIIFHANVFMAYTCLKHSNFLKVRASGTMPHSQVQTHSPKICPGCTRYMPRRQTSHARQRSNYELFNRNNFNICFWSWNYRGCWHQTCPPIDTQREVYFLLIPITRHSCLILLFLVTTSLCQDWAICAPAAFLRCGSHFSGSLSGIKP